MRSALRLGLAFSLWAVATGVLVAPSGRLDLFVILLLAGLLMGREILLTHPPERLSDRLSVFLFGGLLAFAVIVVQKVRQVLNVGP